ncbi:hypothetical protein [Vibrio cholerae]|uniref:hypothetical protein n=1 Tax=Vibrio cholerae TaxID=666 RepID=UPI0004E3983E|nr:hypothetical protein [Vibrio cholerae]KFE28857.1 hypothetical protein DN30_378 [Vibrio cholerae]TXY43964.1 hypothetical protein FXE84_01105 [Vibrio cholerae]
MKNYDAEFKILSAQKSDKTEIYEKHKTAINIVLVMLESAPKNRSERLEMLTKHLGSVDAVIVESSQLQSQFSAFSNLGFILDKAGISQATKDTLIEMCSDVFHITSLLEMKYHNDKAQFWDFVNNRINDCLGNIFFSNLVNSQ